MTLSDLSSIGSLVSGLAVLVSLVYLSLQVRQADKNQRALMNQGAITRVADILLGLSGPSFSGLRTRMNEGETNFSAEEIDQLGLALRAMLLNSQDVWTQRRNGLVDQLIFNNSIGAIRRIFSQPVYRALWLDQQTQFDPEWISFINEQIATTPLAAPVDTVSHFRANLAKVTG